MVDNNNHEDEHEEADTSAMEEPNSVMKEVKSGVLWTAFDPAPLFFGKSCYYFFRNFMLKNTCFKVQNLQK